MKTITPKFHGLIDYASSAAMIASPWLFGITNYLAAGCLVATGIITIGYNLLTNYSVGIAAQFTFSQNLKAGLVTGALLACCPWILGFASSGFVPHLVFGAIKMLNSLASGKAHSHHRSYSYKRYEMPAYRKFQYHKTSHL